MRLKASMINAIKFPLNNVLLNETLCFSGVLVAKNILMGVETFEARESQKNFFVRHSLLRFARIRTKDFIFSFE